MKLHFLICAWKIERVLIGLHAIRTFNMFASKFALRHNGVQLFISHLPRWLRTRRISEPTFRPSGATNHWKNKAFCDLFTFSPFRAPASSFFWLFLFFDLLSSSFFWLFPPLLFHLPILSEVWLLNFLPFHIYIYIYPIWTTHIYAIVCILTYVDNNPDICIYIYIHVYLDNIDQY